MYPKILRALAGCAMLLCMLQARAQSVITNNGGTLTDQAVNESAYILERSSNGVSYIPVITLPANAAAYVDSNLSANTPYSYRIRAQNASGTSAAATASALSGSVTTLTDITDFVEGVTIDQYNTSGGEGYAKATDNDALSKYLTRNTTTWLRFHLPGGGIASQYAITSANDFADRDPKSWVFEGSNDASSWTVLNTQTNQQFTNRFQRRIYIFNNTTSYTYYRLRITANSGASITQFAELEIFGSGTGTISTAVPAAPSALTAQAVSGNQVILNWTDNSSNETHFRVQRSTDSVNWSETWLVAQSNTRSHSLHLTPLTTYYYRLRAENANGASTYIPVKATTLDEGGPAFWQEHWKEHIKLLRRVYQDDDIYVYYDSSISNSVTWMQEDFTDVWKYVKQNYGTFSDPKLYLVFHGSTYSGGHPGTYFGAEHDYRNVSDVGGNFNTRTPWNYGATTHEIGHVVEFAAYGVDGSPAFSLWGDSKWCEIFCYDVYKRLGWATEEAAAFAGYMNNSDDFPRPNTYWFRDWFYPIYRASDTSACLNRYFELVSAYFPKRNGKFIRSMNMGEFVHFWSGAAGFNCQAHADTAFGWTQQMDMQFRQAQVDYPFTYPDPPLLSPLMMHVKQQPIEAQPALWPNPASSKVFFTAPDAGQLYTVDIYSMSGARMSTSRISGVNVAIPVNTLPDGIYLITVSDAKGNVVRKQKIVVNK